MNSKQLLACLLVCAILFSVFHDGEGWRRRRRRRRGKVQDGAGGRWTNPCKNVEKGENREGPAPVVRDPEFQREYAELFDENEDSPYDE